LGVELSSRPPPDLGVELSSRPPDDGFVVSSRVPDLELAVVALFVM
jgi:hypothetical protein